MEPNPTSRISVQGPNFSSSNVKFKIELDVNFGTKECNAVLNLIKRTGFEPGNGCILVCLGFRATENAMKVIAKFEEMKKAGVLESAIPLLENWKRESSILFVCLRLPPSVTEPLKVLHKVAESMGPEFAATNQNLNLEIKICKELKDILHDPSASILASAMEGLRITLKLAMHKDFPMKIAEFLASMTPPQAQSQIKFMGQCLTAFDHFNLDLELRNPTAEIRGAFKDELTAAFGHIAAMIMKTLQQFELLELAKTCDNKIEGELCLSPLLSSTFFIRAPSTVEAVSQFVPRAAAP